KIEAGVFVPILPVYVVGDDTAARQFVLALDESLRFLEDPLDPSPAERRYAERVVKQRLHQPEFRGRVIHAYSTQCAICTLAIGDLLDAAHIVGDTPRTCSVSHRTSCACALAKGHFWSPRGQKASFRAAPPD